MSVSFVPMLTPATLRADTPPAILQITVEGVRAGAEQRYGELEQHMAETCARLGCPNAYLALESVAAPKEIWWLVEYADHTEVERVARAYAENAPLLAALTELAALKKGVADEPVEHMTRYRADMSVASAWGAGLEPFAVIATGAQAGAVFESANRALFTLVSAGSLAEAERTAAALGNGGRVFRVQPSWSLPKTEWIQANPELWRR